MKLPAETAAGESDAPGGVYGNTDEGESERGLVASVHPLLEAFAGNGYHVSDALVRAILMRAGEE